MFVLIAPSSFFKGLHSTSGSFLKSQRLSHPIVEVDEDNAESAQLPQASGISVSLSRDSLESNGKTVQDIQTFFSFTSLDVYLGSN